jgi:hypothetical protein
MPSPFLAGWSDTEEHQVITKLERGVALAHGEGTRDSHIAVGTFMTESITSTVPANPATAKILERSRPELQSSAQSMDKLRLSARNEDNEIVASRLKSAVTASRLIEKSEDQGAKNPVEG